MLFLHKFWIAISKTFDIRYVYQHVAQGDTAATSVMQGAHTGRIRRVVTVQLVGRWRGCSWWRWRTVAMVAMAEVAASEVVRVEVTKAEVAAAVATVGVPGKVAERTEV
jgi:hypothetical protein